MLILAKPLNQISVWKNNNQVGTIASGLFSIAIILVLFLRELKLNSTTFFTRQYWFY
jgi:hypothetical protein